METPLDRAYLAHEAMPEDERLRLRFHERLLDAELFLLLREEAAGGKLKPEVFALETGPVALVFDRDERLAAFLEAPAPYAALSGRRILGLLAGQGIGLGLNLGVAPSSALLPAAAVDWLAAMAAEAPVPGEGMLRGFAPPGPLPAALIEALGIKLAAMAALIDPAGRKATLAEAQIGMRPVHFAGTWHDSPVYWRDHLPLEARLSGPAVVRQMDTTVLIEPDDRARGDAQGNLIIEIGAAT